MSQSTDTPKPGAPTLTFRGGGWVIALAGLLVMLVMIWSLLGPMLGRHPIGDGRTLESYNYDLSTLLIPKESLVGSGNPRGFLPSLDDPMHIRGAEMVVYNEQNRPKFVVTTDRVLGIVINGQAHAWPLSLMNVHEVVNDTVAGIPVTATYSPLCDSAIVFDRRIGGCERQFEVSGLLVDSNLVFCDKSAVLFDKSTESVEAKDHVPSLFLQLEQRAVAGPLAKAGQTLNALPGVSMTTWADWLALHPDTMVTLRDPAMIRRMKEITYSRYFLGAKLEYTADPMPTEASMAALGLRLKSPMILFKLDSGWKAVAIERLIAKSESERVYRFTQDGVELIASLPSGPAVARLVRADGVPLATIPCHYFALIAVFGAREPVELLDP